MKQKSILIIDDEPGFRFSVALILRNHGYMVSEAKDGIEAWQMLDRDRRHGRKIDLIISDIKMPGMDGLELFSSLSARESDIPAIAMTGFGTREINSQLNSLGCKKIIHKPFSADILLKAVSSEIGGPYANDRQ